MQFIKEESMKLNETKILQKEKETERNSGNFDVLIEILI